MSEEKKLCAGGGETPACGDHIVQYSPEYSFCTGCVTCMIVCGLSHEGVTGRSNGRIKVDLGTRSMVHTVLACRQCVDHPCYEACPKKDSAMCVDPETGVVYVDEANCVGCGKCMRACRFTPSRISMKRDRDRRNWKAVKCDLCRGNPEGPQCVRWCPVQCLGLSGSSVMLPDGVRPEGR